MAVTLVAQPRPPYEALRQANRNATWLRQTISVISSHPDSIDVTTTFRIPYSSLLFRKSGTDEAPWSAELSITFDALTATKSQRRERHSRWFRTRQAAEPETSLGRVVWNRNLTVVSYEESRSDSLFVEGVVTKTIAKQPFRVVPIVQVNGQTSPMSALPAPEPPPSSAFVLFVSPEADRHRLINLGANIVYGQRADLVVSLANDSLATVEIWRKEANKDSTLVWTVNTSPSQRRGHFGGFRDSGTGIEIAVSDRGKVMYRFAVPTKDFENRTHQVFVKQGGQVAHRMEFLPRWFDIPTSLLNLDTAIDMMRFALESDDLRELRKGNEQDRERKFKAYWDSRDPTPESAYNELMAEYFERIDHAFDTFSTPQRPGYDSPMGKTWILYGKPTSIERRFPPDGGTIVVWEYPGRRFIFQSTSGFGDFELVSLP